MGSNQNLTASNTDQKHLDVWVQVLRQMKSNGSCHLGTYRNQFWHDKEGGFRQALEWIVQNPEQYLGPLERLSDDAQQGIRPTIITYDRWQKGLPILNNVIDRTIRLLGGMTPVLNQKKHPVLRSMVSLLKRTKRQLGFFRKHGCRLIYLKLVRLAARYGRRDRFIVFLSALAVHPANFATCAARQIPQQLPHRGYWHHPSHHMTVGYLIGLDFIIARGACWFIENNVGATMAFERSAMYKRDPLITNMIDYARKNGYRKLMILATGVHHGMNPLMNRHFEFSAEEMDLSVTLVESPYYLGTDHARHDGIPEMDTNYAMVVRFAGARTTLDYILADKEVSTRILSGYIEQSSSSDFRIPSPSLEPVVDPQEMNNPFPTYVYKIPYEDRGEGILFIKARSVDHADDLLTQAHKDDFPDGFFGDHIAYLKERPTSIQRYIPSNLIDGKYMYKIRSHVLLSPSGNQFLSAHRVIAFHTLSENLPEGLVKNPGLYNVNIYKGARYSLMSAEEEAMVQKATLAVAEGFSRAIETMFQTTPDAGQIKGF